MALDILPSRGILCEDVQPEVVYLVDRHFQQAKIFLMCSLHIPSDGGERPCQTIIQTFKVVLQANGVVEEIIEIPQLLLFLVPGCLRLTKRQIASMLLKESIRPVP